MGDENAAPPADNNGIMAPPILQSVECKQMIQLRSYLDKMVDVLVAKMARNQFVQAMPEGVDKQLATSLHNRFCTVMRTKMCKIVEERVNDYNTEYKLNEKIKELHQIIQNTPNSVSHKAWRPPDRGTIESCVVAHDLTVLQDQNEGLTALVGAVKLETDDLLLELQEVQRRMQENQTVLHNMSNSYKSVINTIDDIVKSDV